MAAMDGRFSVAIDDIKKVAIPVLRHRIMTNFQAQAEGKSSEDVIQQLLATFGEPDVGKYEKLKTLTIPAASASERSLCARGWYCYITTTKLSRCTTSSYGTSPSVSRICSERKPRSRSGGGRRVVGQTAANSTPSASHTATTSPLPNDPTTCTTPIGKRLRPCDCTACRAPASTTKRPRGRAA